MRKENAEAIGNAMDRVERVKETETGDCRGHCLRVRVNININQPLRQARMVNGRGQNPQWVSFQYKRLPMFCF